MSRSLERALFVLVAVLLVSGTSYASVRITGKDVKNSSLTGKDIKNGSLASADFGAGQLPAGATGPVGPRGPGAVAIHASVLSGSSAVVQIGGGNALKLTCAGSADFRYAQFLVSGNGAAEATFISSMNDIPSTAIIQPVGALLGSSFTQLVDMGAIFGGSNGKIYRADGQIVFHDGSSATSVVVDLFLDDRQGTGICSMRGTATPAG